MIDIQPEDGTGVMNTFICFLLLFLREDEYPNMCCFVAIIYHFPAMYFR